MEENIQEPILEEIEKDEESVPLPEDDTSEIPF